MLRFMTSCAWQNSSCIQCRPSLFIRRARQTLVACDLQSNSTRLSSVFAFFSYIIHSLMFLSCCAGAHVSSPARGRVLGKSAPCGPCKSLGGVVGRVWVGRFSSRRERWPHAAHGSRGPRGADTLPNWNSPRETLSRAHSSL